MSEQEKRKYMKIAMNMIGINVNDKYAAMLVEIYQHILMYKGDVNIKQIINIENNMEYQYGKKENTDK